MKEKNKKEVVDVTGIKRKRCTLCNQVSLSEELHEILSFRPLITPIDGICPEMIFVMEKILMDENEMNLQMISYVRMDKLSKEMQIEIRKEMRIKNAIDA